MLKENDYHWFPLRIRNSSLSRLQQMKERLDKQKEQYDKLDIAFDTYTPLGFIKVSSSEMKKEQNDKVVFLDNMQYACKISQFVQITQGEFAGVIGRIKRIRGKRCVVLLVGNEMAAAVVDVPNKSLRYLTDDEVAKLEA